MTDSKFHEDINPLKHSG